MASPGSTTRRRRPKWSETKIAARIRAAYGTGEGNKYKPWLTYSDVGSCRGNTCQPYSEKIGRQMLFFSVVERNAFYVAERRPHLIDYREQLPMDRDETMEIAAALGIKYPRYTYTSVPAVLTIDALATWRGRPPQVIDCKSAARFYRTRAEELREITAVYASRRGWVMSCFTERSFPLTLIQNLEWMRESLDEAGDLLTSWAELRTHQGALHHRICADIARGRQDPVQRYLRRHEQAHRLQPGVMVIALRRLLHGFWLDFDVAGLAYRNLLVAPLTRLTAIRRPGFA